MLLTLITLTTSWAGPMHPTSQPSMAVGSQIISVDVWIDTSLTPPTIVDAAGATLFSGLVVDDRAVFTFDDLTLVSTATITATGSRPLVLLAHGDMTLEGTLQASAVADVPGPGGCANQAFSSTASCPDDLGGAFDTWVHTATVKKPPASTDYDLESAGGGGHVGAGGLGQGGASGGGTVDLMTRDVTGGGAGGSSSHFYGGAGGGGVELGAGQALSVGDISVVGGDGGGDGFFWPVGGYSPQYGSGGGAGGMVVLHAPSVTCTGLTDAGGGAGGEGQFVTLFGTDGGGGGGGGQLTISGNIAGCTIDAEGGLGGFSYGDPGLDGAAIETMDYDGDGYVIGLDCNDFDVTINPGATDVCNDVDDDCDGDIDEDEPSILFYQDEDGDGFGSPAVTVLACSQPDLMADNGDDCDDADNTIYPGAEDIIDQIDQDCDGLLWCYEDADGDGFGGEQLVNVSVCEHTEALDCDDDDSGVFPDATEVCDAVDNNCNGDIDEDVCDSGDTGPLPDDTGESPDDTGESPDDTGLDTDTDQPTDTGVTTDPVPDDTGNVDDTGTPDDTDTPADDTGTPDDTDTDPSDKGTPDDTDTDPSDTPSDTGTSQTDSELPAGPSDPSPQAPEPPKLRGCSQHSSPPWGWVAFALPLGVFRRKGR